MAIIRLISNVQDKDYIDDELEYKQLQNSNDMGSDTNSYTNNNSSDTLLIGPDTTRGKARQYSQVSKTQCGNSKNFSVKVILRKVPYSTFYYIFESDKLI